MTDLVGIVAQNIREQGLLARGARVLVAVSGGVDSSVLLHVLHRLAEQHQWTLVPAHFNHGLRGRASDGDEKFVERTAERLGLRCVTERGDVAAFARRRKLSVEMAARKLRHEFLARAAVREGFPVVALAHHAEDQVELFFLRLLRGSGGEGLAGMKWSGTSPADRQVRLIRPLLNVSKRSICVYAAQEHLKCRTDASNAKPEFLRNRVRHELLPLLRARYQRGLDAAVLRVMEIVGSEADYVAAMARRWLAGQRSPAYSRLPSAMQRRVIQVQLIEAGLVPDFDLVEQLRLRPGKPVSISPDQVALCGVDGRVRVERVTAGEFLAGSCQVRLGRSGTKVFDGLRVEWTVSARPGQDLPPRVANREVFDAERVGSTVILRHWRAGDRFQPIGMTRSVKLQDLFTNGKVLRKHRHQTILGVTTRNEVFWVEGMRISERFKLTKDTKKRLIWQWQPAECRIAARLSPC